MKKAKQKKHIDKTGRRIRRFGFWVSFFGTVYVLLGIIIPVKLAVQPMQASKPVVRRREEQREGLLVLLAGRDDQNRTAFLLVNLDAEQKSITVAALPGETVLAGGGRDDTNNTLKKIFLSKGIKAVRRELEREDIMVDRHALISAGGTAELINRLGGLTVDLDEKYAALLGDKPPGMQILSGDEGVLVFSKPADKDREQQMGWQAQAVASMIGNMLTANCPDNAQECFRLCVNICSTDINVADYHRWLPVLTEIAGQPEPAAVTLTVPGEYFERDGESRFEIDQDGWDMLREE